MDYDGSPCASRQRPLTDAELDGLFGGAIEGEAEAITAQQARAKVTEGTGLQCSAVIPDLEVHASLNTLVVDCEAKGLDIKELFVNATERVVEQIEHKFQKTKAFVNTWLGEQPTPEEQVRKPPINSVHPGYITSLLDSLHATNRDFADLQARHTAILADNQTMSGMINNLKVSNQKLAIQANIAPFLANKQLQIHNLSQKIKNLQQRNQALSALARKNSSDLATRELELHDQKQIIQGLQPHIQELDSFAQNHAPTLANKNDQIRNQAQTIKELENRVRSLIAIANDSTITKMNRALADKVANLNDKITALSRKYVALETQNAKLETGNFNLIEIIKENQGARAELNFLLNQEQESHADEMALVQTYFTLDVEEAALRAQNGFTTYMQGGPLSARPIGGISNTITPVKQELVEWSGLDNASVPINKDQDDWPGFAGQ
jgi:hypothetical protein